MKFEVHLDAACLGALVFTYLREQGFPVEDKAIRLSMEIDDPLDSDRLYNLSVEGIDVCVEDLPADGEDNWAEGLETLA